MLALILQEFARQILGGEPEKNRLIAILVRTVCHPILTWIDKVTKAHVKNRGGNRDPPRLDRGGPILGAQFLTRRESVVATQRGSVSKSGVPFLPSRKVLGGV